MRNSRQVALASVAAARKAASNRSPRASSAALLAGVPAVGDDHMIQENGRPFSTSKLKPSSVSLCRLGKTGRDQTRGSAVHWMLYRDGGQPLNIPLRTLHTHHIAAVSFHHGGSLLG